MDSYQNSEENVIFNDTNERKQKSFPSSALLTVLLVGGCLSLIMIAMPGNILSGNRKNSEFFSSFRSAKQNSKKYSQLSNDEKRTLFETFASMNAREYSSEEKEARFGYFVNYLDLVDSRNEKEALNGGQAKHNVNKFADRSPEELSKLLGYKKPSEEIKSKLNVKTLTPAEIGATADTELSADWRDIYTTSVKDQGYCGSCWAFSGIAQIESDSIRYGFTTTSFDLSEQEIVSCDTDWGSEGCDGGYTEAVFEYANTTGVTSASLYPYVSYYDVTEACVLSSSMTIYVGVETYFRITADTIEDTESAMLSYVQSSGPLSICVYALPWYTYEGGVMSAGCSDDINLVDHCVQLVGYSANDGGYWIVRNSWGADWGEDGYIYLKYGTNMCAITSDPIYTIPTLWDSSTN